jgi:hypothetical protein
MNNSERGISRAFSALWGGVMLAGMAGAVAVVVNVAGKLLAIAREVLKQP